MAQIIKNIIDKIKNKINKVYLYFYTKYLWYKYTKIYQKQLGKHNPFIVILISVSVIFHISSKTMQKAMNKMKPVIKEFQKGGITKIQESDILYQPKETVIDVKDKSEILKQIRSEKLNISTNFEVKNE